MAELDSRLSGVARDVVEVRFEGLIFGFLRSNLHESFLPPTCPLGLRSRSTVRPFLKHTNIIRPLSGSPAMADPGENSFSTPKSRTGLGDAFSLGRSSEGTFPEKTPLANTETSALGDSFGRRILDKLLQIFRGLSKAVWEKVLLKPEAQKVVTHNSASPPSQSSLLIPAVDTPSLLLQTQITKPSDPTHQADDGAATSTANLEAALELAQQQVQALSDEVKKLRHAHAKEPGDVNSAVAKHPRGDAAALEIPIDTFASTLDYVSEAQINQAVHTLNSQISDVVMNALVFAEDVPPSKDPADVSILPANEDQNELLLAAAELDANGVNRGILVEGALHGMLIQQLHDIFFASQVALSVPDAEDQHVLDRLYQDILRTESYKVAQRWKSVTAAVAITSFDVSAWQRLAEETTAHALALLSAGLARPSQVLEPTRNSLHNGILRLYRDAHKLAVFIRRDYLSARMQVSVVAPNETLGPSRAMAQWDDIPSDKDDRILATYALGLNKTDEHNLQAVLLVPKVVTEAVLRHALPSGAQ